MKPTRIMALAVLIVGSGLALHAARARQPGTRRTDLLRRDLGVPGRFRSAGRMSSASG